MLTAAAARNLQKGHNFWPRKAHMLVPTQGLEPWTSRLRVCHSTN